MWNLETGELSGGELGCSVGGVYTSLTGFSSEDNAGSVQLAALGKLLEQSDFEYWDLGMEMEYKIRLGAELMTRADFVQEIHRTRGEHSDIVLPFGTGRRNAKELIDWAPSTTVSVARTSSTLTEASSQEVQGKETPSVADQIGSENHGKKRPHDEE